MKFIASLGVGLMILMPGVSAAQENGKSASSQKESAPAFDSAPVFRASELLPDVELNGRTYRVEEDVFNDGINNIYYVNTSYGRFRIESTELLLTRIQELKAIELMEQIRMGEAFRKSAGKSLVAPLRLGRDLVSDPMDTVSGVATGVGSYLNNVGTSIFGDPNPEEGGPVRTALGVADVRRQYAVKFGVDPYTNFEPLQHRLLELSRASVAGSITVSAAFSFVPGAGAAILGGSKFANTMNSKVCNTSPAELRTENMRTLQLLNVSDGVASIFMDQHNYTLTDKTYIVSSLDRIKGLKGATNFIQIAANAPNPEVAYFFRRMAGMMAAYHEKVEPVQEIIVIGRFPLLVTNSQKLVGVLPVDHVAWTRKIASTYDGSTARAAKGSGEFKSMELWLSGTASSLAQTRLSKRGWVVKTRSAKTLSLD